MEYQMAFETTRKTWDLGKKIYIPAGIGQTPRLSIDEPVSFAGLLIQLSSSQAYQDPAAIDQQSIILEREIRGEDKKGEGAFVLEHRRPLGEKDITAEYIVGTGILDRSKTFSISNLGELAFVQIYERKPSENDHPDMLEITPVRQVGENGSGDLLH